MDRTFQMAGVLDQALKSFGNCGDKRVDQHVHWTKSTVPTSILGESIIQSIQILVLGSNEAHGSYHSNGGSFRLGAEIVRKLW